MKNSTKILIGVAAVVVAVGIAVSCSKTGSQTAEETAETSFAKDTPCPPTPCHFWYRPRYGCREEKCTDSLCYINYGCLDSVEHGLEPDPGTGPTKGSGQRCYIIIPQYTSMNEAIQTAYENFFELGEITFLEDCPADTPKLYDVLPDGWLPAGTYPFSKHGNDAWIDITSVATF